MNRIKFKYLAVILALITLMLFSINRTILFGDDEDSGQDRFKVTIYMDRFSFYSDDQVMLNFCVKNDSGNFRIFNIYDEIYTTFQPVVFDSLGREAEIIVPYRLKDINIVDLLKSRSPRVIELAGNEKVVHSINLKDIYKLETGKEYRVRGFFFPDAIKADAVPGENVLNFKITEAPVFTEPSGLKMIKRGVRPGEVVSLFLNAEKEKRWDDYIKYLKIESYINAFSDFVKIYNAADAREKLKIEKDFIIFLSRKRNDYLLDYEILNETIINDKNISHVNVRAKRYGPKYPFNYNYKFTLEKFRDFWLIIDVEATVIKR